MNRMKMYKEQAQENINFYPGSEETWSKNSHEGASEENVPFCWWHLEGVQSFKDY